MQHRLGQPVWRARGGRPLWGARSSRPGADAEAGEHEEPRCPQGVGPHSAALDGAVAPPALCKRVHMPAETAAFLHWLFEPKRQEKMLG